MISEESEIMQDAADKYRDSAATQRKPSVADQSKAWTERTNDTNGLSIVLQVFGEPTEETFSYLQDFVTFKLQQLKKKGKGGDNAG